MHRVYTFIIIVVSFTVSFSQQSSTIVASKDNTLYESTDGSVSNGAGEYLFVGKTNQTTGSLRRGVLMFDLTGKIPGGAHIINTSLQFNVSKVKNSTAQETNLFRITAAWGEGTSNAGANEGSGAPSTSGDATWIHRLFNTGLWGKAGGDYINDVRSHVAITGTGKYTFDSTAKMISDVQNWVDNPLTNFGWILIGNEVTAESAKRIDSRESATAANRPQLIIQYTTSTAIRTLTKTPNDFELKQNYPNPFNPSTTIKFSIPFAGHVKLSLFNTLGKEISVLIDKQMTAGEQSYKLNASQLSSGIYYYQLQFGNVVSLKKLVLVK